MNSSSYKIYCVDDDADVLESIEMLIQSAGYKIETFVSAQMFLDSVPFDSRGCLILDVCMPGMDGFALQKKLKNYMKTILLEIGVIPQWLVPLRKQGMCLLAMRKI